MRPDQSRERARQIAAMSPGNSKHRCFDELINTIAREHGHGEAVDIFEADAAPDHYEPPSALETLTGKSIDKWREIIDSPSAVPNHQRQDAKLNRYTNYFEMTCPNNGIKISYVLTIETAETIMVESIIEACNIGAGYHEPLADSLVVRFGGKQTMKALHHGVWIETVRETK